MLTIINTDDIALPQTPLQWLEQISQPCAIEFKGRDSNRWRVITTLIHGNEPSGFIGTFNYLKEAQTPECNLAIVIASVRAARYSPTFTHRHIAGEFDLNRRFGQSECHDRVTELARDITEYIRRKNPEAVVDLHNTSGSGPAFSVSISDSDEVKKIASLFTDRMVVTHLVVGSIMEQNFNCPVVTIECGGAMDTQAHNVALSGIKNFASIGSLEKINAKNIAMSYHPTRVTAHQGISLDYGDKANPDVDITLIDAIETLNTRVVAKGTAIGWLSRRLEECLVAINEQGTDTIKELFIREQGKLIVRHDLKIFMATRRADIALSDCIFYVVKHP